MLTFNVVLNKNTPAYTMILTQHHCSLLDLQVTINKTGHNINTNSTGFLIFSYLIIGGTNSKDDGGCKYFLNKLTDTELNNRLATNTYTSVAFLQRQGPGQPTVTFNKQSSLINHYLHITGILYQTGII